MLKGQKMTPEMKLKVSFSRKGKNIGNKNSLGKNMGNTNGFKKGQKPRLGIKVSEETRNKMRLAKLGKKSPLIGRKLSTEVKQKISQNRKGIIQSESWKEKNRLGQYRRHIRTNPNYVVKTRNKRIADNGGFHSNGDWETLKAQYNWTCPCCGLSEPLIILTKDHIIPLLMGGSNNIENIQPLCRKCNSKKHTLTIRY